MIKHWTQFIWKISHAKTLAVTGVRKVVADQAFELPWKALTASKWAYTDLCYTKAKGSQLNRNYWNQGAVDAAVEKLLGRTDKPHSSVSIQLQGGVKDSRSQGYCMQNLVITLTPDSCAVDIYYRSTEVIQKFAADLVFFADKLPQIFAKLGREPSVIRFKFANVYLSAVFMPIFLRYESDHLGFFQTLERIDPKFYRTCGLATRRFFNPDHNYTYRTRVKMFEYWKEHVTPNASLQKKFAGLKGEVVETEDDE